MAITCTNLTSSVTTSNAVSYTTASVTFPAKTLVNLFVGSTEATNAAIPTVTTTGLVWQQGATLQVSGLTRRLTRFFTEVGDADVIATTLLDWGATAQSGAAWSIDTVTGLSQGGKFGAEASRTAAGTAVSAFTLPLQLLTANSGVLCAVYVNIAEAITQEAGWTGELAEPTAVASPNSSFEVSYIATADTSPSPTWTTSATYIVLAVELMAETPGEVINPYTINRINRIV